MCIGLVGWMVGWMLQFIRYGSVVVGREIMEEFASEFDENWRVNKCLFGNFYLLNNEKKRRKPFTESVMYTLADLKQLT